MNSTTNYQPYTTRTGERPVITDANEDDVIGGILADIKRLQAQVPKDSGLMGRVFQKIAPKATISVVKGSETTSGMQEIIQPSDVLREALELALPAEPVTAERAKNPTIDQTRLGEALAFRANVLTSTDTPAEAQLVRSGDVTVAAGERIQTPLDVNHARAYTHNLVATRAQVARGEFL